MKIIARVAAMAALVAAAGFTGFVAVGPALADGTCQWASSDPKGGTVTFPAGATVNSNGVVFSCTNPSAAQGTSWEPAGTTTKDSTSGIVTWYDGNQDPSLFTTGAGLKGDDGDAYVLGSSFEDVGTWDSYANSYTGCADVTCDGGGGVGGLLP